MCGVRASVHVAQKVERRLGRGQILLGALQKRPREDNESKTGGIAKLNTFQDSNSAQSRPSDDVAFVPTRAAGLARLEAFLPRAAKHYATRRNYALGPSDCSTVSALSPWIRHRLISEEEVLEHTIARHGLEAAMAFIQEVFWRSYFKGWLEQHPSVWKSYQEELQRARDALDQNTHRRTDYQSAVRGQTGIACFDHWCHELKLTGYLHNHIRMWFASIWIFTLRLPWHLGADFFLRNLIDGDPASNTLSWRWVAGLHTKGKHYLARPDNIAKFTQGMFNPAGQLARDAEALVEGCDHPFVSLNVTPTWLPSDSLHVVTAEDCTPEQVLSDTNTGTIGLSCLTTEHQSALVQSFKQGAVRDALMRQDKPYDMVETDTWADAILEASETAGTSHVATAFTPVGPIASKLTAARDRLSKKGVTLTLVPRRYDLVTWPHATKGFFKLKKKIPQILADQGL